MLDVTFGDFDVSAVLYLARDLSTAIVLVFSSLNLLATRSVDLEVWKERRLELLPLPV